MTLHISYLDLIDNRVSFLVDAELYKRAPEPLQQLGTDMYARYIAQSAPLPVSLAAGTQLQVRW